ncbi:MAG: DUF819 family protein [Planctomycetes bacterium]|nr:DUF819 family protein [Planctomycetota bacterium]
MITVSALSLYLEQRYKIFQKYTGALVAMVGGMLLSNTGFLPTESASYDIVWDYIIPLTIPLLLMKTDVRRIIKETGRMFWAFHISALDAVIGSVIAVLVLHSAVPFLEQIAPAMTGSYVGGSINFVALVATFAPPKNLVNATIVADNGVMALYFLVLITLPSLAIVRRLFPLSDKTKTFRECSPGKQTGVGRPGAKGPAEFSNACPSGHAKMRLSAHSQFQASLTHWNYDTFLATWNHALWGESHVYF